MSQLGASSGCQPLGSPGFGVSILQQPIVRAEGSDDMSLQNVAVINQTMSASTRDSFNSGLRILCFQCLRTSQTRTCFQHPFRFCLGDAGLQPIGSLGLVQVGVSASELRHYLWGHRGSGVWGPPIDSGLTLQHRPHGEIGRKNISHGGSYVIMRVGATIHYDKLICIVFASCSF